MRSTQAEINDSRIQAVKEDFKPEFIPRCQQQVFGQHPLEDFFKQLMGPMLIGIGRSRTPYGFSAEMIKMGTLGSQSGFNAGQAARAPSRPINKYGDEMPQKENPPGMAFRYRLCFGFPGSISRKRL
jgi:hypothetical protein